jgi:hypothetical protein
MDAFGFSDEWKHFKIIKELHQKVWIIQSKPTQKIAVLKCKSEEELDAYEQIQKKHGKTNNLIYMYGRIQGPASQQCGIFEYITPNLPFWIFYENRKRGERYMISPDDLWRLMRDTYSALDVIHSSGFYHGDLGMPDNIILQGSISSSFNVTWTRALIIDLEGGKIKDRSHIDYDIWTLAMMMVHFIDGENAGQIEDDEAGNVPENAEAYTKYVKSLIHKYAGYNKIFIVLIFILQHSENGPSAKDVLERMDGL